MSPLLIVFGLIVIIILVWVIRSRLQRARRNRLFLTPLAPESIALLERNVALYGLLPEDLRQELYGRINIFLDEKEFFGCAGLAITDEIRITIAGNACLLLLKRDKECFPGFTSILVYPNTYVSTETHYHGLLETEKESVRAGESWHRGPIVLSWADVMRGAKNSNEGRNVVLHEFAHKLDEANDIMDGLPVLRDISDYAEWAEVLSKEYESLLIRVDKRKNSVIDEYGAVSPAEFFAVATESFFEKPRQMQKKLPDLYGQLKRFYGLDPAAWRDPPHSHHPH